MSQSTLQVQAELLENRSLLDGRCMDLALKFVRDLSTAEDLFAKAVSRASGALVTGLLATDFGSAAESSRRRCALIALSKMATALSAEVGAHANELQNDAASALVELSVDAGRRTAKLAAQRGTRLRDERTALEALGRAKARRHETTSAEPAAASAAATAVAAAAGGEACPWLLDLQVQACEEAVHEGRVAWAAELGDAWRDLAASEVSHSDTCQRALALCTHALRPRLLAVTAAAEAAGAAVDQLDGAEEWTAFGQAAGRSLQAASEPAPPAPPNMARVVRMGRMSRRLPSLLGACAADRTPTACAGHRPLPNRVPGRGCARHGASLLKAAARAEHWTPLAPATAEIAISCQAEARSARA